MIGPRPRVAGCGVFHSNRFFISVSFPSLSLAWAFCLFSSFWSRWAFYSDSFAFEG